jgi:hypothetical protein
LFTVRDNAAKQTPIHLLARGDFARKGDAVAPRPLGVLVAETTPELPKVVEKPRRELAQWVADDSNPLTARVMVNRLWQAHFGQGIVATPNDFGRMGGRPSHPELLDWLANEFVHSGYSVKHIHRLILHSNAWRQESSTVNPTAIEKDPENKLLWKFSRRRLEAEEIRDAMLAVSGSLNPKQGGPGIMIPIEKELTSALYAPTQWQPAKDPAEYNRRSLYLIAKRNLHLPFMEVFDAPDATISCPRRETSTHAPQALELLNGALANEQAEALAKRLTATAKGNPSATVNEGFLLTTGRLPSPKERAVALEMLRTGSLREFTLALFNLSAFLYVN